METPNTPSGIPVVVAGIPTVQDEVGIVSPFPYLNPDSEEWKGEDEEGGFDTDGGVAVPLNPDDDNDGGFEDEAEEEDEDDDYDDSDTGFGIGLMLSTFFKPSMPLLPA